jgi:integrase
MSNRVVRVPTYRLKKSGSRKYAVVSLPDGAGRRHDVLLGKYGSKESRAEYARVIAEWEAAGRSRPGASPDLTINELMASFWEHAQEHYRREDGTQTSEVSEYKATFRVLKELYGHTPAKEFGPLALEAVRNQFIRQPITIKTKTTDPNTGKPKWTEKVLRIGLARGVINQRIGRIRRLFRWGVRKELIPVTVYEALRTLEGLQRGRTKARETEPIRPVSLALVEDTLPHLSPVVADLIRLQLATGARSGEVCIMRGCDIDMVSGNVWLYKPSHHKVAHRGFGRVIALGPAAKAIVERHLKPNTEAYLFSPADSIAHFRNKQRAERKTPVQPSQQSRKKRKPRKAPRDHYSPSAIAHAVAVACERNGLAHWHPHQLRHAKATQIRREFGLDHARATLGQHSPQVTELYAELDMQKAVEVARKLG